MSTKITYNGKTTELADGHIATLPCKDFKMETDIVIEAPEPVEAPTVEEWDGTGIVIEGLVKLISFTVDGTSYQATDGMTWAEWVESDYNTAPMAFISDGYIKFGDASGMNTYYLYISYGYQFEYDEIRNNGTYILQQYAGGGSG